MIFSAKKLYQDGCNICFYQLPFHTGSLSISAEALHIFGHGPAYTSEFFAHAVYNCRSLMHYFMSNNIASKIGVAGISLGAYVSSLLVSSEAKLDAAILIAPVFNLPESFMEWFPLGHLFNKLLDEENISMEQFRHAYATCNTLSFDAKMNTQNILLLSGIYDLVALPKYVKLLGEHWNQCNLHWFNYSHVGITKLNPFYTEINQHLKKINFI